MAEKDCHLVEECPMRCQYEAFAGRVVAKCRHVYTFAVNFGQHERELDDIGDRIRVAVFLLHPGSIIRKTEHADILWKFAIAVIDGRKSDRDKYVMFKVSFRDCKVVDNSLW